MAQPLPRYGSAIGSTGHAWLALLRHDSVIALTGLAIIQ